MYTKFDNAVALLTTNTLSTRKPFEAAYELMQNKTDDADVLAETYKKYVCDQMLQVALVFIDVTIYWKAQIQLEKLGEKNSQSNLNYEAQLKISYDKMRKVVNEFQAAVERFGGIKKASVTSVGKDKDGKDTTIVKNYTTCAEAWKAVKNEMASGNPVTFTLYQGWFATKDKGFVDKELFLDVDKKGCFTSRGEMIIPSGNLTINLNGHKISAENLDLNIFNSHSCTNLTITGIPADQLNSDQVQGLYGGNTAIYFNENASTEQYQHNLTLNNVCIKNFKEYGVYYKKFSFKTNTFTYDGGSIENAQKGAILIKNAAVCTISNCEFKNNKAESGGAVCLAPYIAEANGSCTISNCTFENNSASGSGGAIANHTIWKCTAENCTFKNNSADSSGGAVTAFKNVKNCNFTGNSAKSIGGAVFAVGSIEHCTFNENECKGGGGGAVASRIYCSIKDSTFTGNHASREGGAIFQEDQTLNVEGCTFDKNTSNLDGGAIYNRAGDELIVKESQFTGNTTNTCGGAICTRERCKATIENTQFTGNSSTKWDGGALFLTGLRSAYHTLKNVKITGNTAKHRGGGIYCHRETFATGDFEVHGQVIIEGNTAEDGGNNVLLEQKNGSNKCVIKNYSDAGTKIYLDTDYNADRVVVTNADDASVDRYFGDNGRKLYKSGSDLRTNER